MRAARRQLPTLARAKRYTGFIVLVSVQLAPVFPYFFGPMKTGTMRRNLVWSAFTPLFLTALAFSGANAQDTAQHRATLPPLPAPLSVPKPGPATDAPYSPSPILQGGVVVPLYP